MNTYELSKIWFDFCFENTDIITPNHTALYFFAIEHCNRLGWKDKFGFPMEMAKDAIGIKNYRTYSKAFEDLISWGFFKIYQRSKNQYSANVIGIVENAKPKSKALSKAMQKHSQKQVHGIVGIDKPSNLEPSNQKIEVFSFDDFWKIYPVKQKKKDCKGAWRKITDDEKLKIKETVSDFIKYKPFPDYNLPHPTTYLNQKRWEDELISQQKIAIYGNIK